MVLVLVVLFFCWDQLLFLRYYLVPYMLQIDEDEIDLTDPNVDLNKYKKYKEYSSLLKKYDELYQKNNCSGGWMF